MFTSIRTFQKRALRKCERSDCAQSVVVLWIPLVLAASVNIFSRVSWQRGSVSSYVQLVSQLSFPIIVSLSMRRLPNSPVNNDAHALNFLLPRSMPV